MKLWTLPLIATTLALSGFAAAPALADQVIAKDKVLVLACLENMEQTTTWGQCLNLMFQPCVAHTVGGADHVACLKSERLSWQAALEVLQGDVYAAISTQGATELTDLMGEWTGYVGQKCQQVAASKGEAGAASAQVGCEITEMAGLSGEFAACLEGRSTAQFCDITQ